MVRRQNRFSEQQHSELIRLFMNRVGGADSKPELTILRLVKALRASSRVKGNASGIESYFGQRLIKEVIYRSELDCDGFVKPLGGTYSAGFQIVINSRCRLTRFRFTLAHELCHTFFYEIVPEIKFCHRLVDPQEERLCNIGAAELLMPVLAVKKAAKGLDISLKSLDDLANRFQVSAEAMILRLRSAKLWNSIYSIWHPMSGGGFALHRTAGIRRLEWEWSEPHLLRYAWDTGRVVTGRTCLEFKDTHGSLKLQPVFFELQRRGEALRALLRHSSTQDLSPRLPLFGEKTASVI